MLTPNLKNTTIKQFNILSFFFNNIHLQINFWIRWHIILNEKTFKTQIVDSFYDFTSIYIFLAVFDFTFLCKKSDYTRDYAWKISRFYLHTTVYTGEGKGGGA